jgi:hypothetical protein
MTHSEASKKILKTIFNNIWYNFRIKKIQSCEKHGSWTVNNFNNGWKKNYEGI